MSYRPLTPGQQIELALAWLAVIAGVGLLLLAAVGRGHLLGGLVLLLIGFACDLRGSPSRRTLGGRW